MKYYFDPNDYNNGSDAKRIQSAINDAEKSGINKVVIPRRNALRENFLWEIDETIKLPTGMNIVLDNCYLRLADECFCNMFCNSNCYEEIGRSEEGRQENITIEGLGKAVLDGGNYNGLCERNSLKDGRPHISRNTMLLFSNVHSFCIKNIHICNQRWWGMTFLFCSNGRIYDIDFQADLSSVDEMGVHLPNVIPDEYEKIYIKNADGIDLRSGCNNIIIKNITGFTEDDTVALTGLKGEIEHMFRVENVGVDIHNVIIRNVMSDAFMTSNVRLLNKDGIKLYNILIDGVVDKSPERNSYRTRATVRVGDKLYANLCENTEEDTFNILIQNVISRGKKGIEICGAVKDLSIKNVNMFGESDQEDTVFINSENVINLKLES